MNVLGDFVKVVKNFAERYEGKWKDATRFYTVTDMGCRFLIPDGRNLMNSLTYTRVIVVYVDELSSKVGLNELRRIALSMTKPAEEEHEFNISQDVYIFLIRKMYGSFHSRRQGRDIYLFFNVVKFGSMNQIKFRIWKILGRLFIKRAEGIVKSCEDKVGIQPYGFLKELVEFFMKIGEKMYQTAIRNIKKIVKPIRKAVSSAVSPKNNNAIRDATKDAIIREQTQNNLCEEKLHTGCMKNSLKNVCSSTSNSISNSNINNIKSEECEDDVDDEFDLVFGDRPVAPDEYIPARIKNAGIPFVE